MKDDRETEQLWNDNDDDFNNETYHHLLIEQYKIYVEMHDRLNARRSLANIFFLTLHSAILGITALGVSRTSGDLNMWLMLIPLLGLVSLCYAWWRIALTYRHSSIAKSMVIGEMEKRLPSSPLWAGERRALKKRKDANPLSRVELLMPYVFAGLYIVFYCYLLHLSTLN